VEEWH